jgi:thioredoxin-like negative regulator of GroEL
MLTLVLTLTARANVPDVVPPTVAVTWKKDAAALVVTAPEGFTISPDAPADLAIETVAPPDHGLPRAVTVKTSGAEITAGIAVGPLRGAGVDGSIAIQLCDKDSGVCLPGRFDISGAIGTDRKGEVRLAVRDASPENAAPKHAFNTDAQATADRAFAAAKRTGDLVLLDFSAVWCPPCNALAAEVLHAPDHEETLAGVQVAVLDVDHPSSFALKDRYGVTGYPTLVLAGADGTPVDRMLGYPGRDAFLAFVDRARSGNTPPDWTQADPASLSADDAAEGWWWLTQFASDFDAAPWAKAAADSETAAAHLARFHAAPNDADATWLAENAPQHVLDWVPAVDPNDGWGATERAVAIQRQALTRSLVGASGIEAADRMWFLARLDPEQAAAWYAAAFATLRATQTGDEALDRASWTFLATLRAKAGDVDGAIRFLDEKTRTHPDEPTFLLEAASLLNEAGRHAEALERSALALDRSWGDNRLRVVLAHVDALLGLDRPDEAEQIARDTLAEAAPSDLAVRTHRYRAQLAERVGIDPEQTAAQ